MATRIAHLITSLEGGGTENFLFQITTHAPATMETRVFFLRKDGVMGQRIRQAGVAVKGPVCPATLLNELRKFKPDALHTCLYWANQVGRIAGRILGIPVIVSSQRSIDVWQKPWHGWMDRFTLPMAHLVLCNSAEAMMVLQKRLGRRAGPRFEKLENGLDDSVLVLQDSSAARRAYHLPEDAIVGGTLMRLHREKGAELIPDFASALLSAEPRLHLLVGGTGPLEPELKQRTSHHPWSNRLHWLGWENRISRFYSAIDFFWSLSREESFPQTLLEASAMGVPWMAPDVGEISALAGFGEGHIVYPAAGRQDAAAIGLQFLKNLGQNQDLSRAAAGRIRERFRMTRMIDRFYQQIESALQNVRRGEPN
ncbi:MAG: glycosyltransferase [Elusimicrobiota bacterium]|jgi:glycosyltransferase involved in cell wall biosynthesis